jgi:hypothetical protein
MKSSLLKGLLLSSFALSTVTACKSAPKTYELPKDEDYPGYTIIDGVGKDTIDAEATGNDKIAVVLRDISTTSYSFIEPRYSNSIVSYDGVSHCCRTNLSLVGNSGLIVYKFSFIGKGNTVIHIIARQKGLSATPKAFETDRDISIHVKVK